MIADITRRKYSFAELVFLSLILAAIISMFGHQLYDLVKAWYWRYLLGM